MSSPQRPRDKAIEAIQGGLSLTIAEYLIKILCLPKSTDKAQWMNEARELFRTLLFEVSKSARWVHGTKLRIIEELHVDGLSVQKEIDDLSMDASEVLDNFPAASIELPPPDHQLKGNLVDYGFRIEQYYHPEQGLHWKVFLAREEIADTADRFLLNHEA